MDLKLISQRREAIESDAPCAGCGATLAVCKANRGKDPTAPSWFGCCARGALLDVPCQHTPDPAALRSLLIEIETGEVRSIDDELLDSISEFRRPRRWLPPVCMIEDCGCSGEEHA